MSNAEKSKSAQVETIENRSVCSKVSVVFVGTKNISSVLLGLLVLPQMLWQNEVLGKMKRKPKYMVNAEFNGYQEPKYFRRKRNAQRYARAARRGGAEWVSMYRRKK